MSTTTSRRRKRVGKSRLSTEPLSLSEARAKLSPVVEAVCSSGRLKVPISVRGVVKAYVVSAARLDELEARAGAQRAGARPPRIRGTLTLIDLPGPGDSSASDELERQAVASWDRANSRAR